MNIETVNELIRSLESAGELSIRETKVMALAKAHQQLAAENVALKSFGDKLSDMHNALNGEGTGIQGRAEVACQQVALEAAIEEFDAIETPATDRIVAGIKADGVEEFAAHQRTITEEWACKEGHSSLLKVAESAELFAKQLREGADK
ncbi:hypothetical protein LGR97_20110 [Klebsiella quasipneumoniae subsp. similipneumoniae]|uniref:hypothetical protein n=1 Tax=Klebsiella quasipneumoniae TaxID=1463165 RepID=UPI001F3C3BD7|nr:hypothetical protein [Klebsiella quasipneumoniae]MCF2309364.1 hypothetical protein [Klebsiella quasipneumoniae subsp. similipneumoniae]MCF2309918.1 hypothetical protein [Klebsiella quasipneumoniae subsp. similipneumoniae]MCF2311843.1 hypothetical protein [Klebsiella quasipneumoniae subsp. similipneumoniae]